MSGITQPEIRITPCGDSEFYAHYEPPIPGFGFGMTERQSSALSRYFLAMQNNDLVGFVKFIPHAEQGHMYFSYLEVHKDRRETGVSKHLLSALFDELASRKMDLLMSPYTDLGRTRLHPQIERLQKQYGDITLYHEQYC